MSCRRGVRCPCLQKRKRREGRPPRVRQGWIHKRHAVSRLGHRDWNVITEAKVDGKLVVELPVVSAVQGKVLDAPSVDLGNGNVRVRGCAKIEAGEAEAGVGVRRSASGALGEVELAGAAGQNVQVELRGAKFAAEPEAVTALLPRDRVVILKDVVVKGACAIAGGVDAIAGIVVVEARENRVAYALEAELAGPVATISALGTR